MNYAVFRKYAKVYKSLLSPTRDSESGFLRRACASVRLSVAKMQKCDFLKKLQFRAMVSIDDL